MAELDLEHGRDDDEPTLKKSSGRPTKTASTNDLKKTIEEGLQELAEWIKDQELADALREGAPRMAKVLAARGAKHRTLERLLKVGFAADGPLAMLRAFGPTARRFGDRLGAWRERRTVNPDAELACTCGVGEHVPAPGHHVSCPLASIA